MISGLLHCLFLDVSIWMLSVKKIANISQEHEYLWKSEKYFSYIQLKLLGAGKLYFS